MAIEITSSAFTHGSSIPAQHSCNSDDVSRSSRGAGFPKAPRRIAVIMDDPDAPRRHLGTLGCLWHIP